MYCRTIKQYCGISSFITVQSSPHRLARKQPLSLKSMNTVSILTPLLRIRSFMTVVTSATESAFSTGISLYCSFEAESFEMTDLWLVE